MGERDQPAAAETLHRPQGPGPHRESHDLWSPPPSGNATALLLSLTPDVCSQGEDDQSPIDLERHLGQVDRPFRENITR